MSEAELESRPVRAALSLGRWVLLIVVLTVVIFTARSMFLVGSGPAVVVYCALDREFAAPLLDDFTYITGIRVEAKYDVESTKTVGLVQAIIAERDRPRCDLFWNNEILHTLRLQELGMLAAFNPPVAAQYPPAFRDPQGRWHGFAARARVLLVHRDVLVDPRPPASIEDLCDERWRGRVAIAKPLFGTTATHAACLFATWGDERAQDFFRRLKANEIQVLAGNKQVAQAVAAGQVAFGLTDTDDAIIEIEAGRPVEMVYPDQAGDNPLGTLFIPNTLCLVAGAPQTVQAQKLVEFLLSPAVEEQLAKGPSGQIPLNPVAASAARVPTLATKKAMVVNFAAAAARWDTAAKYLEAEFSGP